MTTMQCPLGHPPGPQPFCPICGRATVPVPVPVPVADPPAGPTPAVPEQPAAPDAVPPPPGSPIAAAPGSRVPPAPTAPLSYEPTPPPVSSWKPAAPPSPTQESGIFPSSGIPSYAPQQPLLPGEPPLPGVQPLRSDQALPSGPELPHEEAPQARRHDRGPDGTDGPARSRLPSLLLVLLLLVGAGYIVKSVLFDSGDDNTNGAPAVRRSTAASASARPSAAVQTRPTFSAAQIALALKDPHFRHGYQAGKRKAAAGPVTDREATCREMGVQERTGGYPWGAHDRQGCLVGLVS